jgi:Tc toxin complex TcA C-terminal TcB-binding domain/Neuraminidase-like domain
MVREMTDRKSRSEMETSSMHDPLGNRGSTAIETVAVLGRVVRTNGEPAMGITLAVHRLLVGSDAEIGRTTSIENGWFDITVSFPAAGGAFGGSTVLAVAALSADGEELARVGPLVPDSGALTVDLVVPVRGRALTEFDRLKRDVATRAARSGVAITDLEDTTLRPDVFLLSRSLAIPIGRVRALLAAHRLASDLVVEAPVSLPAAIEKSKVNGAPTTTAKRREPVLSEDGAAALIYSLWRATDVVSFDSLLATPNADLESRLRLAISEKIVPTSVGRQIRPLLACLDGRRALRFLAPAPDADGEEPLAIALPLVVRDDISRRAIADLAVTHGPTSGTFWNSLRREPGIADEAVQQLRTAVDLLGFSGRHVRLLDRLVELNRLSPARLAAVTWPQWNQILLSKTRGGVAVGTPGADATQPPDELAVAGYAAALYAAVEVAYPTERFLGRLRSDRSKRHPLAKARRDIQLFCDNNPDFHVRDTPIELILEGSAKQRASRLTGLEDAGRTIEILKKVQRINRLLPDPLPGRVSGPTAAEPRHWAPFDSYEATVRLIADGIDSAPGVVAQPRAAFIENYADVLGGPAGAERVVRTAHGITDSSLMLALLVHDLIRPGIKIGQPVSGTLRQTFGSVDACGCEDRSAIISPAAYLFDCLKLLQDGPRTANKAPLDVIAGRRSDLLRVAFTGDNTDVELPYIDLVNEILEREVAPKWFQPFVIQNVTPATLTDTNVPDESRASDALRAAFLAGGSWQLSAEATVSVAVRAQSGSVQGWHVLDAGKLFAIELVGGALTVASLTFQTVGTEEERRASPAHVVSAAYDILAKEVFPWHLPFALYHAETQAYLEMIQTSIGAIIGSFESGGAMDAVRRDDVAASYLGLSPDEFAIVVGLKTSGSGVIRVGAPDQPADFWGGRAGILETVPTYPGAPPMGGSWDAVLSYIPLFLKRAELTYVDLLRLLDCYFINPSGGGQRTISILSLDSTDPATCALEKLKLKGLDVAALTRIHRFVRLKRALNWEYIELDQALAALGATDLDSDTVIALTLMDRLSKDTGYPIRSLFPLWGDIDHARYRDRGTDRQAVVPSLYEDLFRKNPQVTKPDPGFSPEPSALTGKLADHRPALMSALTISRTELDALLGDTRVAPADADLTLTNLSATYRFAKLAALLGLSPTDLLSLMDVAAEDPFLPPDAAGTLDRVHTLWAFILRARRLLAGPADIGALRSLLVDDRPVPTGAEITTGQIELLLSDIRAATQSLIAEITYPLDATGAAISRELVKLGWGQADAAAAQRFFANSETYVWPLDRALVPTNLPKGSRVTFHEVASELRCVGTLTAGEIHELTHLPGATIAFKTAVGQLADLPRSFAKENLARILTPTYTAALADLPPDLVIPSGLQRNLTFDPQVRELRFRGDTELLDLLVVPPGASGARWTAFRVALNALKTHSNVEEDPPASRNRFFGADPTTDALQRVAFSDEIADPLTRCETAMRAIARTAWLVSAPSRVSAALAAGLALDSATVAGARSIWEVLVFDAQGDGPTPLLSSATPISPNTYPMEVAAVRRLRKLATLLSMLDAPSEIIPWLIRRSPDLFGLDLTKLPSAPGDAPTTLWSYESIAALIALIKTTKTAPDSLIALFELVNSTAVTRPDWITATAILFGEEVATIDALAPSGPQWFRSISHPQFYIDFSDRLNLVNKTGLAATTLNDWGSSFARHAANRWVGSFSEQQARELRLSIQGLVPRDRWLRLSTSVQDGLRETRRDALVAYLLSHGTTRSGTSFGTEADLFAYLLIDVEMDSCMTTSRMKQAIGSVQTFIQRVILNLEPEASLSEAPGPWPSIADNWQSWQSQFRLWAANRETIIHPENWIEPSLRPDKSAEYRALESRLLQIDLTAATAWQSLEQFIAARAEIAHLEMCAVYEQTIELPEPATVLHVFGRTRATPNNYYHRTRRTSAGSSSGVWSSWSKIECDIEGDHLLPIAMGDRLYLIWPLIKETAVSSGTDSTQNNGTKFEIGFAWSTFDGKVWSQKRLSPERNKKDYPRDDVLASLRGSDLFTFQVSSTDESIQIRCYALTREITTAPTPDTVTLVPPPDGKVTNATDMLKYPSITVKVTLGGIPPTFYFPARVTLSSDKVMRPSGEAPSFKGKPPVYDLVLGDQTVTKDTNQDGIVVFDGGNGDIIYGRSARIDVSVCDPALGRYQNSQTIALYDQFAATSLLRSLPNQQVEIVVAFDREGAVANPPTVAWPENQPTSVRGVAQFTLRNHDRVDGPYPLDQNVTPPFGTLPNGQWWSLDNLPGAPTPQDALSIPGVNGYLFKTPGPYRLLPEALIGPISNSATFAFECADKIYLVEWDANRMSLPSFVGLFDVQAELFRTENAYGSMKALSRATQMTTDSGATFGSMFTGNGTPNPIPAVAFPREEVEFDSGNVFAVENWELFFHGPLQLARLLIRHNRFADAQSILHKIYNPLSAAVSDAHPEEAWQFLPFYRIAQTPPASLVGLLVSETSDPEVVLSWKRNPFSPYAVARHRQTAFMKTVQMTYLDILLGWGDQRYRQGTIESVNEAVQLYLLAEQILGEPPATVLPRARAAIQTFQSLRGNFDPQSGLSLTMAPGSALGLLALEISAFIDPNTATSTRGALLGTMLYFCVPENERLAGYWTAVQDRLQKIRRCEDIEGHRRDLALWDPRVDPGLAVRAQAAGIDIGDILSDLDSPPPHYRFSALAQKASEMCSEVRALGAAMLSAIEKRDTEELALLKQSYETSALKNAADVRDQSLREAQAQVRALNRSRDLASMRLRYYQRLLGDVSGAVPGRGDAAKMVDYLSAGVPVSAGTTDVPGLKLSQHETTQIERLDEANSLMLASNVARTIAGALHAVPNTTLPLSFGGIHLGSAADAAASVLQLLSTNSSHQASRLSMLSGFVRRQDEVTLQLNTATQEHAQFDAQLDAADIRLEMAALEQRNQAKLVEQSDSIGTFLRQKYSNAELHDWMIDQLAGLYFQNYELAYRAVRQAEAAFRRDLGLRSSNWTTFGSWDGLKQGLLAGERLALDLKRMEAAYLDQNAREYEITKHVSLVSLDPNAFLDLKTTGTCTFEVPEWLLDLDHPGHYLRRIRSASVTIPCVIGPYASVNCTVTIEASTIRTDPDPSGSYDHAAKTDDPRFVEIRGASESIVTSSGQADSGLFEANLRDERYLPFESHGAVSRWRVDLKSSNNGRVLESTTDLILHLRYTARDGGPELGTAAQGAVDSRIVARSKPVLHRMLSLRHEYPTEWNRFTSTGGTIGPLDLTNRFPALFAHRNLTVISPRIYFSVVGDVITPLPTGTGTQQVKYTASPPSSSITPSNDTIPLTGPPPDDLLVIVPFVVGKRLPGS